jgi:hypothetical protein
VTANFTGLLFVIVLGNGRTRVCFSNTELGIGGARGDVSRPKRSETDSFCAFAKCFTQRVRNLVGIEIHRACTVAWRTNHRASLGNVRRALLVRVCARNAVIVFVATTDSIFETSFAKRLKWLLRDCMSVHDCLCNSISDVVRAIQGVMDVCDGASFNLPMNLFAPVIDPMLNIMVCGLTGAGKSNVISALKNVDNAIHFTEVDPLELTLSQVAEYAMISVDVALFVFAKGRVDVALKDSYNLLRSLIGDHVPIIGVATRCENNEPMHKWRDDGMDVAFFATQEMHFVELLCTTFLTGGPFEDLVRPMREESCKLMLRSINDHQIELSKQQQQQRCEALIDTINVLFEIIKRPSLVEVANQSQCVLC